jgi:tRNA(Ile)-lysidine synthase
MATEPQDLKARLDRALEALGVPAGTTVAVATSGGADSLALVLLMHECRRVVALTVDHGLRPQSADEAKWLASLLAERGIPHHTLPWLSEKPSANIQAAAREARYGLMADWCAENSVAYLATAHHQDDQAETLLLRLARGSGVYGLAAMAPVSLLSKGGVLTIVRPFLDVPKSALVAYLTAQYVDWIEDPSNADPRYDRVRVRQLLSDPPLEGLNAERLADTAKRLRRTRDALEFYERSWLGSATCEEEPGYLVLRTAALQEAPEEIVLRGLATLCRAFSGKAYTPRMEKLERLKATLEKRQGGQTLYGATFAPDDGLVIVTREWAAAEPRKSLVDGDVWDNRFEISASGDTRGLEIGALGEEGWRQAVTKWPEVRETSVPYMVRLALPAVFDAGQLQALPLMGYSELNEATIHLSRKPLIGAKK